MNLFHFKSISPSFIFLITSFGLNLLTVHPKETQVPKTYLSVPAKVFERLLCSTNFATFLTYSKLKSPLCLIFLTFFLSLASSFNSLINNADAVGNIVISAALF